MSREGGLLCQGSVGQKGNFEVVVPRVGGGFWTFWRANDVAGLPWHGPGLAMGSEGEVSDVVLIEDNLGTSELASVRREGIRLKFCARGHVNVHGDAASAVGSVGSAAGPAGRAAARRGWSRATCTATSRSWRRSRPVAWATGFAITACPRRRGTGRRSSGPGPPSSPLPVWSRTTTATWRSSRSRVASSCISGATRPTLGTGRSRSRAPTCQVSRDSSRRRTARSRWSLRCSGGGLGHWSRGKRAGGPGRSRSAARPCARSG